VNEIASICFQQISIRLIVFTPTLVLPPQGGGNKKEKSFSQEGGIYNNSREGGITIIVGRGKLQ